MQQLVGKRPKKHLQVGLVLKSLTGSRKVIEMLNRLGHCVNYHTVQEIETELTFEAAKATKNTPFGMSLSRDCGTGVAWDNYDRFVETQSGKDTLHDTVGIAYQISPEITNGNIFNQKIHYRMKNLQLQKTQLMKHHKPLHPF